MIRRDMFVREVKDALVNLYDPIHLQTHPLVELLALQSSPGETAGESLRKLLWSTIESLRPAVSIPLMRPEWLNYRLLWLHYVQSFSQQKERYAENWASASDRSTVANGRRWRPWPVSCGRSI